MPVNQHRQRQARVLRYVRKMHRYTGIALFLFFAVVGVTSVLLGWKKNSDALQPPTARGAATELTDWLPNATLADLARATVRDSLGPAYSDEIDRIDVRPDKGIAKFLFRGHFREVQLDGATGAVLSIGVRRSDLIEQIHDGSVLDEWLGTQGNPVKVIYSTVMGLALLVFTTTGFWLWYGPKRMRRR